MSRQIGVVKILKDLIAAPAPELDAAIAISLERLAGLWGGGRAWLFASTPDGSLRLPGAAEDIGPVPDALPDAVVTPADAAPGLRAFLTRRNVARCLLAATGPADAPRDLLCCEITGADPAPETMELIRDYAATLGVLRARMREDSARADTAARMEATLRALPDLLFEIDGNGCYTGFAGGPRELMLARPEDFAGKEVGSVLPPAAAEVARAAVRRVQRDGAVEDMVFALDLPDGRHVFDIRGALKQPSAAEADPAALFLVRDITQAHEMKEELRRLGSITRAMSNLVIIIDLDLRVTWANRAFELHSGWTLDEIRGHSLPDLVRCAESDPAVVAQVAEAIAEAKPFCGQMINKDRHGNRYHVEFNILPLRAEDGTLQGFVSVETVVTQIKEQQAALEQLACKAATAQRRLENAVNALPDAVMIFDADDRLLLSNPAQAAAFPGIADIVQPGVPLREMLRISVERGLLDPPPGRDDTEAFLDEAVAAYRAPSQIREYRLNDGRWFRRVDKRTSDGGLISVRIDVTGRHNQVAALDAANLQLKIALNERAVAEQRLSNIMESTSVGTWELDLDDGHMTACRQWARIFGLETGDAPLRMTHAAFLDLVHPDDRPALEAAEPRSRRQVPDMFEHEFRMRHTDGSWIWVLSRGRIVARDDAGRPRRFVGVDIDVSEQKRLEDEVRQRDAYLTSALESNVAAFAIYDAQNILLYRNSEAKRLLRLQPGLLYGRRLDGPVWTLETLDGQPTEKGPCALAREAGVLVRDIRFAVRWPDGRRQILTCNATPVEMADGQRNTVISFWDITEQLTATERLRDALAQAEAMSRAKSIFLANMSHEIRTPLNGVLGLAEVLSMQITDPDQSRMIATIRQSGETLLSVLNSVLDMSKIEAGKMEIEHVPLLLRDLLRQIDAVYTIQAEEKGLEFEIVTSSGTDLPRLGDPHRIQQILHNLLNNAIKFSSAGSVTLTVSCRAGKPVILEVRDTGVGMTVEQRARVFRNFEQADGSTTRRFGGTGLGLSIVRELVLLMGGEVTLESEPDSGTCVRVLLPLPMARTAEPGPA